MPYFDNYEDFQVFDEAHGGQELAMYGMISWLGFGAMLGGRGFTGFGGGITFAGNEVAPVISWEVERMSNSAAINLATRVAAQSGPVLTAADEALINEIIAQRMINYGISTAGYIFFCSGL